MSPSDPPARRLRLGSAHRTAYSVSKGGLDTLAQVVATGYGKGGIRCNAVAPGIVRTAATANIPEAQRTASLDNTRKGRATGVGRA